MHALDLLSNEEACSRFFRQVRWQNGIHRPRCGSTRIKGHGNYKLGLKRYKRKDCGRTFNDKTGTPLHYSRLSLREWFIIILLFLSLHNSCLRLSLLLDKNYMTIFKALRKLMLKLRRREKVMMNGMVESDEVYLTAGLKSRKNSEHIKRLSRKPRSRGFEEARSRNMG